MDFQLVLQFQGDSIDDLEKIVSFETKLENALGNSCVVDGHDIGSKETNVFILTNNPKTTFEVVKKVLQQTGKFTEVIAAFRKQKADNYTVIWPENFSKKFRIA